MEKQNIADSKVYHVYRIYFTAVAIILVTEKRKTVMA